MEIIFIAAMSENNVIGIDGRLPWHLPNDLKRFKSLTKGEHILMGRKTYLSIGKALPHRHNMVMTRDENFVAPDIDVIRSKDDLMRRDYERVFVIGGEEIFRLFMSECRRICLTLVHTTLNGDCYFPQFHGFVEVMREEHDVDEHHSYRYSFIDYVRESP